MSLTTYRTERPTDRLFAGARSGARTCVGTAETRARWLPRWLPVALSTLSALVGCGDGTQAVQDALVRDSAGISIVETVRPTWPAADTPTVATEVVADVGAVDGPEGAIFNGIRDVGWLGTDRIVLSNDRVEVRIYSADGSHVRTIGGEGDGPGEFRRIVGLGARPDGSIVVADGRLRRITVLDSLGATLSSRTVDGPLPAGARLFAGSWMVGLTRTAARVDVPHIPRRVDTLVAVGVETGAREAWREAAGIHRWRREMPNGLPGSGPLALSPSSFVGVGHDRLVYGSSDRYELLQLDATATTTHVLRRRVQARSVTEADRAPSLARWREMGAPPWVEPIFVDSMPHFSRIVVADAGTTWLQTDIGRLQDDAARTWDVFDAGRRYLGTVRTPAGFRIGSFSDDRVAGVWTDDLGVEHLQVRRVGSPLR